MKPIRHPLVFGPGHRTRQTELLISERDNLLVEAARFYPGLSDREIAKRLRDALLVYRNGRWLRDANEQTCPLQHRGKLLQVMWMILKTIDAIPGDRTIRAALARGTAAAVRRIRPLLRRNSIAPSDNASEDNLQWLIVRGSKLPGPQPEEPSCAHQPETRIRN